MNKALVSILGLVALSGCAYDYYEGGVRYTQDGPDCIYYSGEQGRRFSNEISSMRGGKKIVYRNTICAHLYDKDNFGQPARQERQILTPAAVEQVSPCQNSGCGAVVEAPVYTASYGCTSCTQSAPVLKRRYVIVSGM